MKVGVTPPKPLVYNSSPSRPPPTPACIVQHADARLDRVHYCNFALRASSAAVPRQDNLARRRQSGSVRSYRSGPGIN